MDNGNMSGAVADLDGGQLTRAGLLQRLHYQPGALVILDVRAHLPNHRWIPIAVQVVVLDLQGERQCYFNGSQPFVMNSCGSLPCSATSGKIAAHQKKSNAGFPGSSNKQEGILQESQLAEYSAHGQSVLPLTLWNCTHPATPLSNLLTKPQQIRWREFLIASPAGLSGPISDKRPLALIRHPLIEEQEFLRMADQLQS